MDTSDSKRMERLLVSVVLEKNRMNGQTVKQGMTLFVVVPCDVHVQGGIVSRQKI
jgi:hypothetical protein